MEQTNQVMKSYQACMAQCTKNHLRGFCVRKCILDGDVDVCDVLFEACKRREARFRNDSPYGNLACQERKVRELQSAFNQMKIENYVYSN